jgi:hypothetical protein
MPTGWVRKCALPAPSKLTGHQSAYITCWCGQITDHPCHGSAGNVCMFPSEHAEVSGQISATLVQVEQCTHVERRHRLHRDVAVPWQTSRKPCAEASRPLHLRRLATWVRCGSHECAWAAHPVLTSVAKCLLLYCTQASACRMTPGLSLHCMQPWSACQLCVSTCHRDCACRLDNCLFGGARGEIWIKPGEQPSQGAPSKWQW